MKNISAQSILDALRGNPLHFQALAKKFGITDEKSAEYRELQETVSGLQSTSKKKPVPILKNAFAKLGSRTVYPIYVASEEDKLVEEGKLGEETVTDLPRTAEELGFDLRDFFESFKGGRERK